MESYAGGQDVLCTSSPTDASPLNLQFCPYPLGGSVA